MCISPLFITVKNRPEKFSSVFICEKNTGGFNYFPSYQKYLSYRVKSGAEMVVPTIYRKVQVPCGKCVECMKAKQNDLAVRAYIEANKRGSMHFLTLTYSDDYLPLAKRVYMADKSTGEVYSDSVVSVIPRSLFSVEHKTKEGIVIEEGPAFHIRKDFIKQFQTSDKSEIFYYPLSLSKSTCILNDLPFFDDNFEYYVSITPSLYRKDVRLWLKAARIAYVREFGYKLPEFTYVCVGEFGSKTHRPHYHIAFFGLNDSQAFWLASRWSYGYNYVEPVSVVNKDGSSGFLAAAKYIGKYMYKGVFECPSVKAGDVEKPRYCTSINFGIDLNENLIAFYRCYDIYGKFDINTSMFFDSDSRLNVESLKALHEEVFKRSVVDVNGFKYHLPKNVLKRIWCVKDSKGVYHQSLVSSAMSSFIQSDFLDDFINQFRQNNPFYTDSELDAAIAEETNRQKIIASDKERVGRDVYKRFYSKSKF